MGRGKIEIKKIENANSRQVTFSKRRSGLFKKANELAILCEAEVAVIIFSNTGKFFGYASSSMAKILSRYNKCLDLTQNAKTEKTFDSEGLPCSDNGIDETNQKKQQSKEADALKEQIEKLKLKEMRLLGKDFTGMGLPELRVLEQQLSEGLLCIKERKEQLLVQEPAQSKMQEQHAVLENETLRRQVEELQAFFPSTSHQAPLCFEYRSPMEQSKPPLAIEGSGSPETACNGGVVDEDSDTTLQLGPPSSICLKKEDR